MIGTVGTIRAMRARGWCYNSKTRRWELRKGVQVVAIENDETWERHLKEAEGRS